MPLGENIMKKMFLLFCLVVPALTCFAQNNIEKLRWVEKADAVADANTAIEKKDFRFLGIAGYTITFPGIPQEKQQELTNKYGSIIIEGTGDVVEGEEHIRLISLAKAYAETYNAFIINNLTSDSSPLSSEKHNFTPENGYVPNEETAISIAVAVWIPIYGKKKIENEKPYKATLKKDVWYIEGSFHGGLYSKGGVAEAEIDKKTGQIIRVTHGK